MFPLNDRPVNSLRESKRKDDAKLEKELSRECNTQSIGQKDWTRLDRLHHRKGWVGIHALQLLESRTQFHSEGWRTSGLQPPASVLKKKKWNKEDGITESLNVKRELTVILYKVVYFKTRLNASSKRRNEQMRHLNQKKKKSGMVKRVRRQSGWKLWRNKNVGAFYKTWFFPHLLKCTSSPLYGIPDGHSLYGASAVDGEPNSYTLILR